MNLLSDEQLNWYMDDQQIRFKYDLTDILIHRFIHNCTWTFIGTNWYNRDGKAAQRWFNRHIKKLTKKLQYSILHFESNIRDNGEIPDYDLKVILTLNHVLEWSWRKIARYYNKDHRAVQRWVYRNVKKFGMRRVSWIFYRVSILAEMTDNDVLKETKIDTLTKFEDTRNKWIEVFDLMWEDPSTFPEFTPDTVYIEQFDCKMDVVWDRVGYPLFMMIE